MTSPVRTPSSGPALSLAANWRQFTLLVVVTAFVGAMVGLERAVLPLVAQQEFGLASRSAILSFIATFGIVKALANLVAGRLSDRAGRRRILLAGWLFGLPVPFLIMLAPSWGWIVFANVLLGCNQGLAWSTTVIMKIDLVGPARRGLAMGLNEASGYLAVSLAAFVSGYVATSYGLRPAPFYLGVGFALAGLLLSAVFVRESQGHARHEALARQRSTGRNAADTPESPPAFSEILRRVSWKDRVLFSASQAGMVNNLNDGMAWGLFPVVFAAAGLPVDQIGLLAAVYPGVWGLGQLATGALSDRIGRKVPIVAGMWVQAAGVALVVLTAGLDSWLVAMVLLGIGTALVYPTLLAVVSDVAPPTWRASAVGVYRLWRDSGYVAGALLAGALADLLGISWAVGAVAALTFASGLIALLRMEETEPSHTAAPSPPVEEGAGLHSG